MRVVLLALAVHAAVNRRLMRRAVPVAPRAGVSVLVPARDEAARIQPLLRSLQGQGAHEVLVLDDGSSDGTPQVAAAVPGVRVLTGAPLPEGWIGKSWACDQLARAATGDVLLFLDADVVLAPGSVAALTALLDDADLVSAFPTQQAPGATRLVQPLLTWSVLTFLPLRLAERSPEPLLSAANGQVLAITRDAYRRCGGHAAVRDQVTEDLALARAVKAAGGRCVVADGTGWATTRMYDGPAALVNGYATWLHTTPPLVPVTLAALYLLPLLGRHRRSAYALGVAGRLAAGGRPVDAALHPLSVAAWVGLDVRSRWLARRGRLTWRGRRLPAAPARRRAG